MNKTFKLSIDDGSGDCRAICYDDDTGEAIFIMPLGVFNDALKAYGKELFR